MDTQVTDVYVIKTDKVPNTKTFKAVHRSLLCPAAPDVLNMRAELLDGESNNVIQSRVDIDNNLDTSTNHGSLQYHWTHIPHGYTTRKCSRSQAPHHFDTFANCRSQGSYWMHIPHGCTTRWQQVSRLYCQND
jgi:hypothetical protein